MKKVNAKVYILAVILQCLLLNGCATSTNETTVTNDIAVENKQSDSSEEKKTISDKSQKEYTELEIEYNILIDGTAEVSGYSGDGNRATIDMDYDGHDVVRIAESAFEGCTSLESVLFWASIEEIGKASFKDCTSLSEISIPVETVNIGDYAFYGCSALSDLIIWGDPNIGDYAFADCTSLEEISISYDTKYVGEYAFNGCENLATVTIWNDATVFGYEAFGNCPKLSNRPNEEKPKNDSLKEVTSNQSETTEEVTIASTEKEEIPTMIQSERAEVQEEATTITVTMSEDDFKGLNYAEAETLLRDMGFKTFEYQTLSAGERAELANTISSVEIKNWGFGKGDFSKGDTYENDAIVVLWYYEYEEKAENLTVDNNTDLATLVTLKDPCDPFVSTFASTYYGQIIEFDGCISNIQNHNNYDTRYDILINAGDFDPNTAIGPNFRLTDVNAFDMDLDALWLTDVLSVGCNVHVIAEVGKYNSNTSLFELDVVKVEIRN